jgi:enoyl-CoA hydratase/carnithine racemase
LGILPNHGGIVRLARWVGKGQAMKVAMGYPMTADDVFRFGLAQRLVPHADLVAQTTAIADRLAELPPLASRLAKESLNRGLDMPNVADAACIDLYRFMALSMTEGAKEVTPPGARGVVRRSAGRKLSPGLLAPPRDCA